MPRRAPIPPAFRAAPFGPIDLYAVQLRIWAAKLIIAAARYRHMEFAHG
ncbi:hypothetical protein ACFSTI_20895 [Rhizorhabdus histidinilytica]|uniref:Uncharacterized protein n=1 Tax=Rhizorhabdus histidinilytica TaxID=439228 RepID=A0A1T5BNH1_9SPHN|nr:hypothetical protein [Rhizorhabdus histidinilytica]SKB48490.1 hypothetical protein SAMN06295920_103130 [Rhizorhabdus histidinilytica]